MTGNATFKLVANAHSSPPGPPSKLTALPLAKICKGTAPVAGAVQFIVHVANVNADPVEPNGPCGVLCIQTFPCTCVPAGGELKVPTLVLNAKPAAVKLL